MPKLYPVITSIPTGLIGLWSGLIANIPSGWQICDGTNGTPDMRGRFARGAPAATEAGAVGGADTVSLTIANLASHTHTVSIGVAGGGTNPFVTESGATGLKPHTSSSTGSGTAHENRPAYRELIFIMKL